ncbi:hypothetical protein ACFOW6_13920 [Fodinicurvata halophila]|uniref:Uncharacterized protein n=1 Tax=Fodinicurvata halophila TaxID=1419723 RepID=A0ABV8UQ17_9PROT
MKLTSQMPSSTSSVMPSLSRDLVRHRCIGCRPAPQSAPYRWEFEEDGIPFDVAVEPQITTNDLWFMLRSTLAGAGITFATEGTFRPNFWGQSSARRFRP